MTKINENMLLQNFNYYYLLLLTQSMFFFSFLRDNYMIIFPHNFIIVFIGMHVWVLFEHHS